MADRRISRCNGGARWTLLVKRATHRPDDDATRAQSRGAKFPSLLLYRASPALVNGRAVASCRSADRAKRVSNDRSPFISFFSHFHPSLLLSPSLFLSPFGDGGIYRAALCTRARTLLARLARRVAHSSLIMNGLFIVVDAYLSRVRRFLRFHCAPDCSRPTAWLPLCREKKKWTLCGLSSAVRLYPRR